MGPEFPDPPSGHRKWIQRLRDNLGAAHLCFRIDVNKDKRHHDISNDVHK